MLTTFAVAGYRSLVELVVPLSQLTVISGANGTGKSNLYRARRLLATSGSGGAVGAIAREGGIGSVRWAGPRTAPAGVRGRGEGTVARGPVSIRIGFSSDAYGYLIDFGQPQVDPARSYFVQDPEIKREQVFTGPFARPTSVLVDRTRGAVRVQDGGWRDVPQQLGPGQSVLVDLEDATALPDTLRVRHQLGQWRFYDQFRTDPDAPARAPQVGTRTRWLGHDGAELAAVWATAIEAGSGAQLDAAVGDAFPGSRVDVAVTDGIFRLQAHQDGLLRPLSAAELSDGTLRYFLLCAALLPADPPPLIVVNEPEASLHEHLIDPLAALIRSAAERTQVIVVTHSSRLRTALADATSVELVADSAGTRVRDQGLLDTPPWHWPTR